MSKQERIVEIAFEAMKVADDSPDRTDFRVKPEHIEPIVRAEMPGATDGVVAAAVRDVFRELERYSSKRPMINNGQYIFVEVERPYSFPEQSKIARDKVAMVIGYAVAGRNDELPEDFYEAIKCEATGISAVLEAYNGESPVQLDLLIDDFLGR